jgi:hypothetical protein
MQELLEDLTQRIKALGGDWAKYTVVGSFLLYVLGYLSLRFHLTAIGIGTDLAVLDERYLFTGARFLVYLGSSLPIVVLILLPVGLVIWATIRLIPKPIGERGRTWVMQPTRLAVLGVVFTVIVIQAVMRQCFFLSNLLLAPDLSAGPDWLVRLLLDDRLMPLYFSLLVAACAVPIAILVLLRNAKAQNGPGTFATSLLACLAAVQLLLLPINYGVLIADKTMPRVATLGDRSLGGGEEAWLVWEGKDGITFLVRDQQRKRALVTVPRAEVKRMEILGFDRILPTLFSARSGEKT